MKKTFKFVALLLLGLVTTANAQATGCSESNEKSGKIKQQPSRMLYADTLLNKSNSIDNIIVIDDNNESYTFSEGQLGEDDDFSGTTAMLSSNDDYFLSEVGLFTVRFAYATPANVCSHPWLAAEAVIAVNVPSHAGFRTTTGSTCYPLRISRLQTIFPSLLNRALPR